MAASTTLPPCGIYKTTAPIGDGVPAGRLVYFHNHGDPGPGVYLPEKWVLNRAEFSERGYTLPAPVDAMASRLQPLPNEGFYRVTKQFYCCEKKCRSFEPEEFVQLGYNGNAEPILFSPELTPTGFVVPDRGSVVSASDLAKLSALKVSERESVRAERTGAGTLH